MTAWGSVDVAVEAMRRGARDFVQKPWDNAAAARDRPHAGRAVARAAPAAAARSREPGPQAGRADRSLIAEAPAMRPVLEIVQRVGPSDANVLITGENGTGKGTIAQAIHAASPRAGRGLVTVNAGGPVGGRLRERAVRPREGRVHRRQERPRRPLRAGGRRHAVPRRDRERAAQPAAEAAARPRDRRVRAGRLVAHAEGERAHPVGDQRRPVGRSRGRPVPPGSAVPPEHDRDPHAGAARSPRGHPRAGRPLPAPARPPLPEDADRVRAGRHAGAARPSLAGQHPRARSRRRARRADGRAGRRPRRRSRPARRTRRRARGSRT